VESKLGQGTTILFTIDACVPNGSAQTAGLSAIPSSQGSQSVTISSTSSQSTTFTSNEQALSTAVTPFMPPRMGTSLDSTTGSGLESADTISVRSADQQLDSPDRLILMRDCRVLIIDGSDSSREAIAQQLRRWGFQVVCRVLTFAPVCAIITGIV